MLRRRPRKSLRRFIVFATTVMIASAGCASVSPTQVGQTAGSMAGAVIVPGLGMPIGALIGTLAGLVVEKQIDKGREAKERMDLNKRLVDAPASSTGVLSESPGGGQPTRVWVDERVENGRLVNGHFEQRVIP